MLVDAVGVDIAVASPGHAVGSVDLMLGGVYVLVAVGKAAGLVLSVELGALDQRDITDGSKRKCSTDERSSHWDRSMGHGKSSTDKGSSHGNGSMGHGESSTGHREGRKVPGCGGKVPGCGGKAKGSGGLEESAIDGRGRDDEG